MVEARTAARPVGSLDAPVGATGDLRHADLLADSNAADPVQLLVHGASEGELESRLRAVPERTRCVLELPV